MISPLVMKYIVPEQRNKAEKRVLNVKRLDPELVMKKFKAKIEQLEKDCK